VKTRTTIVAATAAALVLAACGTPGPDPIATDTPAPPASTETETEDPGDDATEPEPGPTEPTELPGEPFGRAIEGETYHVVGVAFDDTLNVRIGPGPEFAVVAQLDPMGSAVATGEDRLVDSGLWLRLDVNGTTGWANYRFLSIPGLTDDITSQVRDAWGGDEPAPETMEELALLVAETRASQDGPESRIVIVVEATVGDLGEITVDVLDLGDDSVAGERLVVFGEPVDGGFMLRKVERTILCDRGVDDSLCV
jgi:hypothetical protein